MLPAISPARSAGDIAGNIRDSFQGDKHTMMNLLRNLMGGAGTVISPQQYKQDFSAPKRAHTLIDVRTPMEFQSGHIPGALNIDVQVLPARLKDVPKDKPVVLYCRSGNRSASAAGVLQRAGYTEIYDLGGIGAWAQAGFAIR